MMHLPDVGRNKGEEEYFFKLNCELCENLHKETLAKSSEKDKYKKEIKALVEEEQAELERLIDEGQKLLTEFINGCATKHQDLSEKYGGTTSDDYTAGWQKRVNRASKAIADLSNIFKD